MSDSGKPGHILTIPDSLGRDIDKGLTPPIEAFMSDGALQAAEKATRAAAEPVHAQDLRPISAAEAARRTTFDGTSLPALPATRRVIPAPFARDRISGAVHHGKEWVSVRAWQLQPGDIVPGTGRLTSVTTRNRYKTRAQVMGWEQDGVLDSVLGGKLIDPAGHPLAPRADDEIAVGTDIIVTGAGGVETIWDSASQVRAFRPLDPGP